MWKRTEFDLKTERLESVELDNKPFNGWLSSKVHSNQTFRLFGFKNCFRDKRKKKKVRQMDHSVHQMIDSAYTGLSIAGIDCSGRFDKSGLKRVVFYVWHYTILTLLIVFNITSLLSLCISGANLQLVIDFIRISSVLYRFLVLTNQKNKFERLVGRLEKSLELFPNVKLVEYNYGKFVAFVILYSCAQGIYLHVS